MRNHLLRAAAAGAAEVDTAWDTDANPTSLFTGTPQNWFYIGNQESTPEDLFFKPDGTRLYIVGSNGDDVNEYTLSTAWDVSTASYVQNFSVSAQESQPHGIFFKDDGTKMYIVGATGDDVNEYTLSTAWDISTASYVQNFSVAAQDTTPESLSFKSDGTEMYVIGDVNNVVLQYTLSTAWDTSTASYTQGFTVTSQESSPKGLCFKSDGTKMYITGSSGVDVNEYTLSTAWDISTATYSTNFNLASQDGSPHGIFFKSDGTEFFMIGQQRRAIWQYSLSTAWDVSTASFTLPSSDYLDVSSEEANPTAFYLKPDGTKLYITGYSGDEVNEYTLSTAWEISSASFVQNFSVSAQEGSPHGLFFKGDGTKMYVAGSSSNSVNEYTLSTAWDVSTASYVTAFSVASQESSNTRNIYFKPDGAKMYVAGETSDAVHEYDLSTSWDVSTATFNQSFVDTARLSFAAGLFFKTDGAKMYVTNRATTTLYEFALSTAWDVSTATVAHGGWGYRFFSNSPRGIFFKNDGTKLWVSDQSLDTVHGFTLSPR